MCSSLDIRAMFSECLCLLHIGLAYEPEMRVGPRTSCSVTMHLRFELTCLGGDAGSGLNGKSTNDSIDTVVHLVSSWPQRAFA